MKCQAAVIRGVGRDWDIEEITLDPPHEGEVLVKMAVAGVCHSDDHYATGDGVMSPELTAIVEANGGAAPEYFPLLGGQKARASSKRWDRVCGRYAPATTSPPHSFPHAVPVGGVCRA